jgi:hypothetical protein
VSRRAFLAGSASAALVAACGGSTDSRTSEAQVARSLVKFFGSDVLISGIEQRATFGIGNAEGVVSGDVPASLDFLITAENAEGGPTVTVDSRREGLPRPYYPLLFTADAPGIYTVSTVIDDERIEAAVQVNAPDQVALPQPGQPMVPLDTPIVAAPNGVNPICTRETQCPLHEVTLTAALGEGRPVALLISTPRFCQVAICGPVLDVLLSQQAAFPDVRMVHAEVYTDETTQVLAPVIDAYGLTYEPALFLARSDGSIATRFDNIFDATELGQALRSVS